MGNNGPTDGWFYRGRGLIQITGLTNYRDCGNALKIDLVKQPELLAQDEYAARSAAWFYASRGCLRYPGDLARVTQIINGGQNGIDDRRARFLKAKRYWWCDYGNRSYRGAGGCHPGAIAGAFGIGHARGTSKAEAKADQQRTEENAAATVAAAERKAEVTKEASDVQQTVSICLMTMLIGSCAKTLPAPVVVDTACNWVRIIYLTDHDIDAG
jgi:hypothetical protein